MSKGISRDISLVNFYSKNNNKQYLFKIATFLTTLLLPRNITFLVLGFEVVRKIDKRNSRVLGQLLFVSDLLKSSQDFASRNFFGLIFLYPCLL